jgi:hypothetical protein
MVDSGPSRRRLLQGLLAAGGLAAITGRAFAGDRSAAACRELYIYGLPALEMARARARTMGPKANQFRHVRRLADHASRAVTTPNNDTLYSSAWLDLRAGPVEVVAPATGGRYFSLAMLDMHSNNFHITGTRVTGGRAHRVRLVPPDATPTGDAVRAPTWWVWAQGRTLVDSPADLAAAHAVQDGLSVTPAGLDPRAAPALPAADAPAHEQLACIARLLEEEAPPTAAERGKFAALRAGGMTGAALAAPDAALIAAAAQGVADAKRSIAAVIDSAPVLDGWIYSRPSIGDFGTDHLYRAAVAVWGLAALPQVEAIYVRAAGGGGRGSPFDGAQRHRLRFASDRLPPVGAFWSLSMYEMLPSGELFFSENPLRRYSIGDRTPGLVRAPDGSLEVLMSADDPGPALRSNWLPCPRGPFTLVLRAYLPGKAFTDGSYRLPPVERW